MMDLFERFVRDITFPLISLREGLPDIRRHLKQFEVQQYLPVDRLREIQWTRVSFMLQYAYDHTRFYRRRFDDYGVKPSDIKDLGDMKRIPILTKDDIRENLSGLISYEYTEDALVSSGSGGTTGVWIKLFYSKDSLPVKKAATYRSEKWTGWDIGQKVGYIWPALQDHDKKQKIRSKVKNVFYQRMIFLPAAMLNERVMEGYVKLLNKEKPKLIKGFANPVHLMAEFILQNDIDLEFICNCITTGEPLYPHQRKAIEDAFGGKVFDSYGAREVSLIGQECEMHKGYHINMECSLVEFVSNEGMHVHSGELGDILVTDLVNHGMPFIRYKVNDKGIPINQTCMCGRGLEMFGNIVGRDGDVLRRIDGGMVPPSTFLPYFMGEGPQVGKFQVIQDRLDHLIIQITDNPLPDEHHFSFYRQTIRELFGDQMQVDFRIVKNISCEKSGKYRFSKCEILL